MIISGAPLSSGAPYLRKFGNLSIREILVINWPSVRSSAPLRNQCEMSNFLASMGACNLCFAWYNKHSTMVNWQLSKQGIRWTESNDRIAVSVVNSSRSRVFLKFSADQLLAFNRSQAQDYVSQSYGSLLKLSIDLWISLQWFLVARLK